MNSAPYRRINIVGAPGSGSTTLGRALSAKLGFSFVDADSFYWKPTTPPFKEKNDPDARLTMLLGELGASHASIVSGSVCGWGAQLEDSFDLVIFLSLPTELRLQRIEAREISLFGGADPVFLAWAAQYEEGKLPVAADRATKLGSKAACAACCASRKIKPLMHGSSRLPNRFLGLPDLPQQHDGPVTS